MRADHEALKRVRVPKMPKRPEHFDDAVMMYNVHSFDTDRISLAKIYIKRYAIDYERALELYDQVREALEENEPRRKFVVSFMHYEGANYKKLTTADRWRVYCEADGFGYQRPAALKKINGGYDWSHVRDSTIDGWKRMEDKIKRILKRAPSQEDLLKNSKFI